MALLTPIYNEQMQTAILEDLVQNIDLLNASSAGTILMSSEDFMGNYLQETFYDRIASLVERRDINSDAVVADKRLSLVEDVEVNIDFASKVFETRENMRRRGRTIEEMTDVAARQYAQDIVQRHVNLMIGALVNAVDGNTNMRSEALNTSSVGVSHLLKADELFGERYGDVAAYLMNAQSFHNLRADEANNFKIENVGGLVVAEGMSFSLGKPVIVTNAPALTFDDNNTQRNRIMALTPGAIQMTERAGRVSVIDEVTNQANLGVRWATEGTMRCGLKGYSWDITNGGSSPTDAALQTGTNWDLNVANELTGASLVEALAPTV